MKPWLRDSTNLVQTEISESSVGMILLDIAGEQCDTPEDVDSICEWTTNAKRQSFCEGELVSRDPRVALLVDAANLLINAKMPKRAGRKGEA